jgi:hypothetical protein
MSDMGNQTRDERRMADRRAVAPESMHANPEVMGRTEPIAVDQRVDRESKQPRTEGMAQTKPRLEQTMDHPTAQTDHALEQMNFWPQMGEFRQRLDDIQSEFINEPRTAVKKAELLVEEAVDHMAKSMREHVKRMHGDIEGNADTEKLRLMMRSFREFIDSLDSRRAA